MIKNNKGFIILLVVIIISLLLLLAFYFLDFIITDTRISQSHKLATKTYYLAEAGINEAIWKLTNDSDWNNNFTTNPTWQDIINRIGVFDVDDGYQVTVQNIEVANAEITSTAFINTSNQTSQRIVKTKVYKSLNPLLEEQISIYAKDDISLHGVNMDINESNTFSDDDTTLNFFSTLNVDGNVSAIDNISISWTSTINASALYSNNYPPSPDPIDMPQIDFDSADPNSYLNRADQVYSQGEFSSFLNNNPNATLNGITYVQGNINIPKGITLTINGVLVIDGNFKIGISGWPFWQPDPKIYVNKIGSEPAGILSKKTITFGALIDEAVINGLLYAGNTLRINNITFALTLTGGMIAYDVDFNSLWQPITVNYEPDVINTTLGNAATSPVINIEHWEEEY